MGGGAGWVVGQGTHSLLQHWSAPRSPAHLCLRALLGGHVFQHLVQRVSLPLLPVN